MYSVGYDFHAIWKTRFQNQVDFNVTLCNFSALWKVSLSSDYLFWYHLQISLDGIKSHEVTPTSRPGYELGSSYCIAIKLQLAFSSSVYEAMENIWKVLCPIQVTSLLVLHEKLQSVALSVTTLKFTLHLFKLNMHHS